MTSTPDTDETLPGSARPDAGPGDEGREDGPPARRLGRGVAEWAVIVVVAVTAAFLIKQYLIQAFYIPSESMEHTLEVSDRVLVNKLSYRLHDVHRGDVVVFERPPEEGEGSAKDLIKRVVAVEGETVEGHDGGVYVNGKRLQEPYLANGTTSSDFNPQRIPPGHVWVMGDNRPQSRDSRFFGSVPESLIVGRAFVRVWPIDSIGLL